MHRETSDSPARAPVNLEAIAAEVAAQGVIIALLRLKLLILKYDSNQPRVPAGSSDGGQWKSGGGTLRQITRIGRFVFDTNERTRIAVTGRNHAGGADVLAAYRHWLSGTGTDLDVDFSKADISDLKNVVERSARGELSGTFHKAISESLDTGSQVFVSTRANIDTNGIVIGRVNVNVFGWLKTSNDDWLFEGSVTANGEQFDFNSDAARGVLKNLAAIAVDSMGSAMGAKDYRAYYSGSISIRASGMVPSNIRRGGKR